MHCYVDSITTYYTKNRVLRERSILTAIYYNYDVAGGGIDISRGRRRRHGVTRCKQLRARSRSVSGGGTTADVLIQYYAMV